MSATLVERLRALGVASVFDASEPRVTAGPGIRPVWTPVFAAGPAHTLETEPADNLALHRAIGEAPPGSIVVAATGRSVEIAVYGDLLSEIAVGRGLAGLVTDGAVRDIDRIAALGFPVFSAGVTVRAPSKRCWGEVGGAVTIGEATIAAGDWVLGDGDGVIAVAPARSRRSSRGRRRSASARRSSFDARSRARRPSTSSACDPGVRDESPPATSSPSHA